MSASFKPRKTLLIIGSGPQIGLSTALEFSSSSNITNIALVARNATRLEQDRKTVLAHARSIGRTVNVQGFSVDLTKTKALEKTLGEVQKWGMMDGRTEGELGCVVFNAARVAGSEMLVFGEDDIVADFQITTTALYTTFKWALPHLERSSTPSFLVTSGLLHDHPIPPLFSLALSKAAQRTLVLTLQNLYGMEIHISLLYIDGPVGFQEVKNNPKNVAEKLLELWEQVKENWVSEVVL